MKGLVVNKDKSISLKNGLNSPVVKPGQVLVEVKSASVNPFDVQSAAGRFDEYFKQYFVSHEVQSGLEFSGVVVQDGLHFKRGDKVFGYVHMITGEKSHAQLISIEEDYIAVMPDNLSYSEAASMPLGALTTLVALQDIGKLNKNDRLLINGASGGLGIQAIQIAKILGAHVTAIAGVGQQDYLQSYGADVIYDYNLINMTDLNETFDVILDLTNLRTLQEMKALLVPEGTFIPGEPNEENGGKFDDPQFGYLMVEHGDRRRLSQIANWVTQAKLRAVVDSEFNFDEHKAAFKRVTEKGRQGRVVMSW